MFDPTPWRAVPFHFWSFTVFVFGCIMGSFLNVCIYRMPRGESLVSPPSHCPHCNYSIPWYLNIPLFTWLFLRGRCAHCRAPISARYFWVELLTGVAFLGSWLAVGRYSPALALAYCLILSGLIVATFIDLEHFIIPDEITIGGMVVGFLCSLAVPALHRGSDPLLTMLANLFSKSQQEALHLQSGVSPLSSLLQSVLGMGLGAGLVYLIVRVGKLLFGKQRLELEPDSKVIFTETALILPDQEIPFDELFYRKSDVISLEAKAIELVDRCYQTATVKLSPEKLLIGEESLNPEQIPHMEMVTNRMILPREAMGFGDVKFMGAIGAFLGWQATVFSLMVSSVIGALVGVLLIAFRKQEWSSRIPYGPYIALAAVIWMFGGHRLLAWWVNGGWLR
jgi:leader peptidase (prepilin peptidase)/N-methyltransferase